MLKFTLYEVETGLINCNGVCPDEDCLPQKPDGFDFLFGVMGDPETQRVQDGEFVPYQRSRERDELIAAIETERDRRIAAGFWYDFKDERGKHLIGTTERDNRNWDRLSRTANAHVAAGNPDARLTVLTNTGSVVVTAHEWQSIMIAQGEFEQPVYAASFALLEMEIIPQDIENQEYWT